VSVDSDGVPVFKVHEDAAWDHIRMSPELERLAPAVDAVFFGTLGQRCDVSRESTRAFLGLLRPEAIKLFDLNLRAPWFSDDLIAHGLDIATVVKLSDDELESVSRIAGLDGPVEERVFALVRRFDLRAAALTRGPQGSVVCVDGDVSVCPAVPVEVVDTVGAGDAFAAAFVVGLLEGWDIGRLNARANRVAAFVCSQPGATPNLPPDVIDGNFLPL
jgi:fructokinase